MKEALINGQRAVIANHESSVVAEPGEGAFDDPAAGAPSGSAAFQLELVAAAMDVSRVAASRCEFSDPRVGVAAVKTERLRILGRRFGPLDRERVERRG